MMHKKIGEEHDHRVPITEDVKDFGEIGTHGLPDYSSIDSKLPETSCIQSHMHFDDSVESMADSDHEDGELQMMLTSPLYAQKASVKADAFVVQEREVSAQSSHSSADHRAPGKPAALFSPIRNEQRKNAEFTVEKR